MSNLVSRRLFPVALPVASLGAVSPPPTIGTLRRELKKRLDKLHSYDLFLRDRSVLEWWKDNAPAIRWLRKPTSVAIHDESHEFWSHLSDAEKQQYVGEWIKVVERGVTLSGDARGGGIGLGYGPNEPTPPKRAEAINDWLRDADDFIGRFEKERQNKRVAARLHPSTVSSTIGGILGDVLKPVGWAIGIGAVGVVALVVLTRPKFPNPLR